MSQHIIPTLILRILARIKSGENGPELSQRIEKFFLDIFHGEKIERDAVNDIVRESELILQNKVSAHRIAAFRKVIYGSFDRSIMMTNTT